MWPFRKKVVVEIPREDGTVRKARIPKASIDALLASGAAEKVPACRVHVIHVARGQYDETWIVGDQVQQDAYERFKDASGDLYAMVHMEAGEPVTNLVARPIWEQLKAAWGG